MGGEEGGGGGREGGGGGRVARGGRLIGHESEINKPKSYFEKL